MRNQALGFVFEDSMMSWAAPQKGRNGSKCTRGSWDYRSQPTSAGSFTARFWSESVSPSVWLRVAAQRSLVSFPSFRCVLSHSDRCLRLWQEREDKPVPCVRKGVIVGFLLLARFCSSFPNHVSLTRHWTSSVPDFLLCNTEIIMGPTLWSCVEDQMC